MSQQAISGDFQGKAAAPDLMKPEQYKTLLENLLTQGTGFGKTEGVGAYLMQDILIQTQTSSGQNETAKPITVEKLYIVMDIAQYPSDFLRGLVVKDIAKNWGGKIISERDLDAPDFKGPGIWTGKKSGFEFDYVKADESDAKSSLFKPNPEAFRVCLQLDEAVKIPVAWGSFTIEKGGTLAIRERDVADLAKALHSIRSGEQTIEQALYKTDDKGNTVAKFDVYGMEPKFLENNYNPVALKPETQAVTGTLAQTGGAKPKGKTFG